MKPTISQILHANPSFKEAVRSLLMTFHSAYGCGKTEAEMLGTIQSWGQRYEETSRLRVAVRTKMPYRHYHVEGYAGWLVCLTSSARRARSLGIADFGPGGVKTVRRAIEDEIAEYKRLKGYQPTDSLDRQD